MARSSNRTVQRTTCLNRGVIDGVEISARCLLVHWTDGSVSTYPWAWIRDHSHDPATLHPTTRQRQIALADIDPGLRAAAVEIVADQVIVTWTTDVPPTTIPIGFLHRHRAPAPADPTVRTEPTLWDADTIIDQWPTVEHDAVMSSDDAVRSWLDHVATYGFCTVVGTPPTAAATEALLRRVGYVRETIFGGMWDFQADLSKADTAYTNLELLPHTDGTYSHDAPGLQLLHCLAFDGTGGESTMVDGFRIADEMRRSAPELYDVLATVVIPGHYLGDGAHLMAARPVLRHDGFGQLVQVSFNNADRAPLLLPPDEMGAVYRALREFEALANDLRLQWRRVNPPGEAMLFDNWRVLHGRTAYTGHRHLCGGYVNREDYESRRRVLAS